MWSKLTLFKIGTNVLPPDGEPSVITQVNKKDFTVRGLVTTRVLTYPKASLTKVEDEGSYIEAYREKHGLTGHIDVLIYELSFPLGDLYVPCLGPHVKVIWGSMASMTLAVIYYLSDMDKELLEIMLASEKRFSETGLTTLTYSINKAPEVESNPYVVDRDTWNLLFQLVEV